MEDWKRRYDVYVANFEHAKKGCKRLTTNQIDEISNDKRGLLGAITDIEAHVNELSKHLMFLNLMFPEAEMYSDRGAIYKKEMGEVSLAEKAKFNKLTIINYVKCAEIEIRMWKSAKTTLLAAYKNLKPQYS
jgi:ribosome-binding ATPase YchF (GTP1/OBG family)